MIVRKAVRVLPEPVGDFNVMFTESLSADFISLNPLNMGKSEISFLQKNLPFRKNYQRKRKRVHTHPFSKTN